MRKFQSSQFLVGEIPISEIEIDLKSRDDIPQVLLGLQCIYEDKKTLNKIINILEPLSSDNGRPGMNLWRIFVLAILKLALNCDYDRLHELANQHLTIRQMLGVSILEESFELKTIKNNLKLLSPEILDKINTVIVNFGHKSFSKKKKYMQNVIRSY